MGDPDATSRTGGGPLFRVWRLTYPVMITNFAQILLTVVDTALLGHYSAEALGAIALAAPIYLVALMVVRGWATATQVLAARCFGSEDHPGVGRVADLGLALATASGVVVGSVLSASAPLLATIGEDSGLAGPATGYLQVMGLAVPCYAATSALQGAYAGVGATRVAMYTTAIVNVVNLPAGLLLIFWFRLGVQGAAMASVLSTVIGTGYVLWYGRRRFGLAYAVLRWRNLRCWRDLAPRLWAISWPDITTQTVGYGVEVALVWITIQLGGLTLAASRLLDTVALVSHTAMMACGTGVAILAGQRLGAGAWTDVQSYLRAGLQLSAVLGAIPALPLLIWPDLVLGLLTSDRELLATAAPAAPAAVLSLVPMLLAIGLSAVLRAAGDTRTVMRASLVGDALFLVPCAWLFAVVLRAGLPGIYLGWVAYGVIYLLIVYWRFRAGGWKAVADSSRLSAD